MAALHEYNKKRDFSKTKEPKGAPASSGKKLRFVVQRHHASRLHYDFRLEMDGVLKSWAVPKGPSLNPADKRLAMMVEDHPYSYRTFEGEIPKGNYGFGTVTIFDEGFYKPLEGGGEKELLDGLKSGSLKIVVDGKKLKGEFALVKIKSNADENAWLLIKHRDKYAVDKAYDAEDSVSAAVKEKGKTFRKSASTKKNVKKRDVSAPTSPEESAGKEQDTNESFDSPIIAPMLATLSERVPDDSPWLFERKLDGFRAITEITGKSINVWSRNGLSFNKKFPSISHLFDEISVQAIVDGEIVAEDARGRSNFQLLQHGEPLPSSYKLKYYVFDLLALDGNDMREFSVTERKEVLKLLIKKWNRPGLVLVDFLNDDLTTALRLAKKEGWEGVIAKEADSRYVSGKRSSLWRKIKVQQSQEAIVVGYTKPSGSRASFGALVLAVNGDPGLTYVGNVGTGFSEKLLKELGEQLSGLKKTNKPFDKSVDVANENKVTWVEPHLIAEIEFSEWTKDGHLRHPVFKALRSDKNIQDIKRVEPIRDMLNEEERKFGRKILKLTNQKKIYWPDEQIRKGDLVAYYEQVGELMLPFLKDKPISMNRYPNGIAEPSFFQKDLDKSSVPNWLKTVELSSESTGGTVNYLICNDIPTLLWIANMGSIEINPWLASYKKKLNPTFAVLDIDPNGVDFLEVIAVANTAKDILDAVGVRSFVKTSGSTGLHIYIHVNAQYDFDVARDFIQMLAELVHEQHTDTTSLERSPNKRKNKIYLDFMQNKRAQTVVAPYSVRPKPGATVSCPLDWSEVQEGLTIEQFTMDTVLERVATHHDPWADIFVSRANLKKALNAF
ncbi:DNA ligase D [Sphingobacterium suaedae]|uniref:DNA ligase (ATP) n=1 Tax=Sphingobacterium suaedae TaxID=1686402 RepID=A0ABW5KJZ6_9SPHI